MEGEYVAKVHAAWFIGVEIVWRGKPPGRPASQRKAEKYETEGVNTEGVNIRAHRPN